MLFLPAGFVLTERTQNKQNTVGIRIGLLPKSAAEPSLAEIKLVEADATASHSRKAPAREECTKALEEHLRQQAFHVQRARIVA